MRRKENVRRRNAGRKIFPGILLGAVCLFSACSVKETEFTAGEVFREETAAGSGKAEFPAEPDLQDGSGSEGQDSAGEAESGRCAENPEDTRAGLAVVYVCGQVNAPGVYELEEGSRIADAVELAGGMTAEAAADVLNLAQCLADGQMIRIPSVKEMEAAGAEPVIVSGGRGNGAGTDGGGAAGTGDGGLVSLNKATKEQLMTLPGIGESKADAIVNYRREQGGFGSVEEIMNISGIKEGVYLKIKDKITI